MDRRETLQWMYRGSAVFDIFALPPNNTKRRYIKKSRGRFSHQWSISIFMMKTNPKGRY